jgi:hypothetical protein
MNGARGKGARAVPFAAIKQRNRSKARPNAAFSRKYISKQIFRESRAKREPAASRRSRAA